MVKYFLLSLLQLLSGVSIPLHTVRYGSMKVPIVLHYQMESDTSQLVVAPGWTLRIGEDACAEDDAGNRIEISPSGIFWPRGAVNYAFTDNRVQGFTVTAADGTTVCRVAFQAEQELQTVSIYGRDSTELRHLTMAYAAPTILRSITSSNGGSVEFDFIPEADFLLKRSVCRKDAEGLVTGRSEYVYDCDSLSQTITETVADSQSVIRKTVRRFADGQIRTKEEYTGGDRLKRSISYHYTDGEPAHLERVTAIRYPHDNLALPDTSIRNYKYAAGKPYPYPIEVETRYSQGTHERLAFAYPFCPAAGYGPVADSLLRRGRADAVLSVSRWKDGVFLDSTTVIYDDFPVVKGKVFRPSALVYSDSGLRSDTCLKYTAYDNLGLRTSRAKVLRKRSVDCLPPEAFKRAPDPLADLMREQRSYEVCAAWPAMNPNQEFGESYLFEGTGTYLGKVEAGEPRGRVIADQGVGETPLSAYFSDPDLTPSLIDNYTTLELVSTDAVQAELTKAGAFEEGNQGFFKGMFYLWRESQFNARLDFASNCTYDIYPNVLYVTEAGPMGTVVHDNYNFGNYLWGAAALEVGVPQWMALLGSHLHSFFSPFSFGSFDSRDDIFSIRAGYHWDGR